MIDVGDAVILTFTGAAGATVTAEVTSPAGVTDGPTAVSETGSTGEYPFTFIPDSAGMWRVVFRSSGTGTAVQTRWVRAEPISSVPPLAVPEDVAVRWRALTATEDALVSALIDDASRIVRARVGTLDARIASGDLDRALAAAAVANMVLRVMRNPNGVQSWTVDDYTERYGDIRSGLWLDDADLSLLAAPGQISNAFTIRPAYQAPSCVDQVRYLR